MTEHENEWLPLGIDCKHCGAPMDGRRITNPPGIFRFATPVEYRHANGSKTCTTVFTADPYDGFKAATAFDMAARRRDEGRDA